MKKGTLISPRHAKFVLWTGCVIMLLVATVRLTALAGPPIVVWTTIRSHGNSVEQLPKALSLYVGMISQMANMTTTEIWLRLASRALADVILAFLAVVLLLRKPWSRIATLVVCLFFSLQHSHAAAVAFKLGLRHGIRQVGWVLLYIGLGFLMTRPSIAALFGAPAYDRLDATTPGTPG